MNGASLIAYSSALLSGALAFSAIWKERRTVAHLAFAAGMAILSLESFFSGLSWNSITIGEMVDWQRWRIAVMAFLPGAWLLFSLSYGRGNYREFLERRRHLLAAAFLLPLLPCVFFRESLVPFPSQVDAGRWVLRLGLSGTLVNLLFLICVVMVLMNLERTFRAAVGTIRWRIKYMILGLGVLFVVRCYTSSQALLFHAEDPRLQIVNCVALFFGCVLILRSLFRAGHFDLDVYPSHSILQNSLTVLLAGIYLVVIGVFAKVVTFLGGDQAFALKTFLVLTGLVVLTVLLVSDRVRLYIRQFVSRQFRRPFYDYRSVWRRFTEATASCINATGLCQAAVKSVSEMLQVLSVTVWLVDSRKESLFRGASTFLSEARAEQLRPDKNQLAGALQALLKHREPVDIDRSDQPWAETLRQCHPDEFRKGGNRVCVPLIVGDELLGIMILGDRVSGAVYTWEEFDLLKCIGAQIAASLLNVRLSQKLLETKELEAFQTMSTFFVHDLKNTASTLSLMLRNLPAHFDDPAFRADALRGVSKTVTHINRLIGRLGSIRQELQLKPVEADLNDLVTKALAGWEESSGVSLTKELHPLPKIQFDPEQILKVATNLIFNAGEAVAESGEVRIETDQNNGWAVLTVADTGCGMSQEFLNRSLFRPFQTTKKSGLGIGMFQSKMIVEAHKGRIEVTSEAGKGTIFRVFLPISTQNP